MVIPSPKCSLVRFFTFAIVASPFQRAGGKKSPARYGRAGDRIYSFAMRLSIALLLVAALHGQPVTDLWLRGYSVIPQPRKFVAGTGDLRVDGNWRAEGPYAELLRNEWGLRGGSGGVITLAVRSGAVETRAEPEVAKQAYRIEIRDSRIEVIGNDRAGLFYGVQTLLQLYKEGALPKGTIEDWPALSLRFLHWDTKHHQDRIETLKRYLEWAAKFKVNMIGFELEDKFSYPSHPVIGAPGAFTPQQLQELVNYVLERHIQIVPEIQAPAHMGYVLKHKQFADFRADGMNYQVCMCDPRAYELIFSIYDDVIQAT